MLARLKKGDRVVVIAGRDKGAVGEVLRVDRDRDRVLVEGISRVKRHQKPTQAQATGGIQVKEAFIHASNVMHVDPDSSKPTRVRVRASSEGVRSRVAVRSDKQLQESAAN